LPDSHRLSRAREIALKSSEFALDIVSLESALAENRRALLTEQTIDRIAEVENETRARAGPNVTGVFEESRPTNLDEAMGHTPPPVRYRKWVRAVDPRRLRETPQFHVATLKADENDANETRMRKGWESKREVWMTAAEFLDLLSDAKASVVQWSEQELKEGADASVYRRMASKLHPD